MELTQLPTLVRRVDSPDGHTVTVLPKPGLVVVELGTDTAVVQIPFTDANDLRAIAGHLMAEADQLQRYVRKEIAGD